MPILNGQVESIVSILVSVSDVSSILEENIHHLQMTLTGSQVKGSDLREGGREGGKEGRKREGGREITTTDDIA